MQIAAITFIVFAAIVGASIVYIRRFKLDQKQILEQSWGKSIERFRNFYEVKKYAEFDTQSNSHQLTEQTLRDIDVEYIFNFIDRTETAVGQQYLYSKVVNPSTSVAELKIRETCSDFFFKNEAIRKKAKLLLSDLAKKETNLVADLFDPKLIITYAKYETLLKILCGLALLSTILCWIFPIIALPMLFLFGLNLMVHLIFRNNNSDKLKVIRQVYQLIKTADKLVELKTPVTFETLPLAHSNLRRFKKTYHFLDFGIPLNDLSSIAFYLLDLLRAFFLIEVQLLKFSYNEILKNRTAIEQFYIYVGQCEMALSTASIKSDETIVKCTPNFDEKTNSLSCHGMVHPLVIDCTPNSLLLKDSNAFITGSNMAGKSTFLRAIIVNSVLAQSLNLCFAESFTSAIMAPFSSIKIADNLQAGVSFYFEEVNIIHDMVRTSHSGLNNLFVIDEIFKGTNTVERIALSKAILQYLSKPGNIVIASSHDLELVKLLGNSFELYHFAETILHDRLHFDHKIKVGPLKTKNAIKILEMEGFPIEIVNTAKSFTQFLENS